MALRDGLTSPGRADLVPDVFGAMGLEQVGLTHPAGARGWASGFLCPLWLPRLPGDALSLAPPARG